ILRGEWLERRCRWRGNRRAPGRDRRRLHRVSGRAPDRRRRRRGRTGRIRTSADQLHAAVRGRDGAGDRHRRRPAGSAARGDARGPGAAAVGRNPVLSQARRNAVRRGGAGGSLASVCALLSPARAVDRAVLRRPLDARRPRADPLRQAAGPDRPGTPSHPLPQRAGNHAQHGEGIRVTGGTPAARAPPPACGWSPSPFRGGFMSLEGKRACVIGAGFGGLALPIRLQAAGVATTLIEARDKPGGRAYYWQREGFTFDAGPTVITDPDCLRELWALTGHDMAEDVELMPVSPFYRLSWPDGTSFDYSN